VKEIGQRPWHKHPVRLVGFALMCYFLLRLLMVSHLALIGRPVPGFSGSLKGNEIPEAGAPVLYVYHVAGTSSQDPPGFGWRRGIQWGGQEISVFYSPLHPRMHFASLTPRLTDPSGLWCDVDFLLRIALFGGPAVLCLILALFGHRLPTALPHGWNFLHGLERHRQH
jgi:hypothetical protein